MHVPRRPTVFVAWVAEGTSAAEVERRILYQSKKSAPVSDIFETMQHFLKVEGELGVLQVEADPGRRSMARMVVITRASEQSVSRQLQEIPGRLLALASTSSRWFNA